MQTGMADFPTLQDEYQMLIGELRQNREIQLQSLLSTPIWIALFFGLLSAGGPSALQTLPALVLVPVPLVYASLLLVLNRRSSADQIVAYFRTAFEQKLARDIGWNFLLPEFRKQVRLLRSSNEKFTYRVPQRLDFITMMWMVNFVIALSCLGSYGALLPGLGISFWTIAVLLVAGYLVAIVWIFRQATAKTYFVEAWQRVLLDRAVGSAQPGRSV
ncbi:MAG: hypothetical protein QOH06_2756 [Acidobacteriota bacterium]|jgi:hypothetical protein|nr:hypothetical protein [Acidobacteriota bacterium]